MIPVLLAALLQELQADVRETKPDVRLVLRGPKANVADALLVRRRVVTSRDGKLEEGWAEAGVEMAELDQGALRAEVSLGRAGSYQILLGGAEARLAVSRLGLGGWKGEVDALRDAAKRLLMIAMTIDQAGTPTAAQAAQIRKRLQDERERFAKIATEFNASPRALGEGLDRLYYHRSLLRLPAAADGEREARYGPPPKEKDDQGPTAVQEVKPIEEIISREGAVLLLDEFRLLLGPGEKDSETPADRWVLRWRDRGAALAAIKQAFGTLGGFPELEKLVALAETGSDAGELRESVRQARAALFRP